MKRKTLYLCHSAIIAALYVALTYLSAILGLSSGAIQCRFSEALCVLPYFTSAAVPGLTVGCLVANLLTGTAVWADIVFGTLATLIGAIGTLLLRKIKWFAPIPPIVSNTFIIPFVLKYAYHLEDGVGFLMITVGIGELISVGMLGFLLLWALEPYKKRIFKK